MYIYKQTCPECYFEICLDKIEDSVSICPNCKGKKIAWQKIEKIEDNEHEKIEVEDDEEIKEPIWEEEFGVSMIEDDKSPKQAICLKYIKGIIQSNFEIWIKEDSVPCILGRSGLGSEYFIYDTRISNEHFCLDIKNGMWILFDNKSTNGTSINGQRMQPYVEIKLNDGDIIKLGKTDTSMELEVRMNVVG